MRKILFILVLLFFCSTAKAVIIPLYDPNAVHFGDSGKDWLATDYITLTLYLEILERSTNPTAPDDGEMIIWLSDGTGFGDAGDVMVASSTGGVAKYGTLFDHSGGTLYQAAAENVIYAAEDVVFAGENVVYP